MTPKEKAKELFDKYKDLTLNVEYDDDQNNFTAKQCALIAVDEIISTPNPMVNYWPEVKQEIEKL